MDSSRRQQIKSGTEFNATIRINPKKYTDAYITDPDGGSDILIDSLFKRNGALDGDLVKVVVNKELLWILNYNDISNHWHEWSEHLLPLINKFPLNDQLKIQQKANEEKRSDLPCNLPQTIRLLKYIHIRHLPFAQHCVRRTANITEIIERRHSRVAAGVLSKYSPDHALFSPSDHRLPRMLIALSECPLDFASSHKRYKDTLFIARLEDSWIPSNDNNLAFGTLLRMTGDKNSISSKIEAALLEAQIDDTDFPKEVLDSLDYLNNLPQDWIEREADKRLDLRDECIFTIDPKTARDLDDAVSIKELGNDCFEVGVHIADVSYFVSEMSLVDHCARLRTTSVYLVDKVIPMLPRILCEKMCSLNPNEPKLAYSVIWTLDKTGKILKTWFGRTIIESCIKLSYEQAQDCINDPNILDWVEPGLNMPELNKFDFEKIAKNVNLLNELARYLRKSRFENGALKLEQVKIKFELDETTGFPTGFEFETRIESQFLIEEFMLLANISVAAKIHTFDSEHAFLRRHPPSDLKKMKELKEFCQAMNVKFDSSTSATIQQSLDAITSNNKSLSKVVSLLLLRGMQNAEYICAGTAAGSFHHFGLDVPLYTHFTSPIRRYPDIIVHRQLSLALKLSHDRNEDKFSLTQMGALCTRKKLSAKYVSDTSTKLYFGLFLKKAGFCELNACVNRVQDRSFDVILVDFDRSGRIYLDPVNKFLASSKFNKQKSFGCLELTWFNPREVKSEHNGGSRKKGKLMKKLRAISKDCPDSRSKLETFQQQPPDKAFNTRNNSLWLASDSDSCNGATTSSEEKFEENLERSASQEYDELNDEEEVEGEKVYMLDIKDCGLECDQNSELTNRQAVVGKVDSQQKLLPANSNKKTTTIKLLDIIKVYATVDKSDISLIKLFLKTPHDEFNERLLVNIR